MYLAIALLLRFSAGIFGDVEHHSSVDVQFDAVTDDTTRMKFTAFDNDYEFNLSTSSILSPNFRVVSDRVNLGGDEPPEESLRGTFYTTQKDFGSLYVENAGESKLVHGIINDELYFYDSNGVQMVKKVSRPLRKRAGVSSSFVSDANYAERVTVEVLVLLDEQSLRMLTSNSAQMSKYLGIYWNSVQRRYNDIKDPKIKFVLTGVGTIEAKKELKKALRPKVLMNAHIVLELLPKWLYAHSQRFPKFDIAVLHTGLDLTDTSWNTMEKGRAMRAGVCQVNDDAKTMNGCGVYEDSPPNYTGVLTTAHEVAHILGATHDNASVDGRCSEDDGYLMTPAVSFSDNSWHFSECTVRAIKANLRNASCLNVNSASIKYPIPDILPGNGLTMKDICARWFGPSFVPIFRGGLKNLCAQLGCNGFGVWKSNGPPPEGTTCDVDMICKNGSCVKK